MQLSPSRRPSPSLCAYVFTNRPPRARRWRILPRSTRDAAAGRATIRNKMVATKIVATRLLQQKLLQQFAQQNCCGQDAQRSCGGPAPLRHRGGRVARRRPGGVLGRARVAGASNVSRRLRIHPAPRRPPRACRELDEDGRSLARSLAKIGAGHGVWYGALGHPASQRCGASCATTVMVSLP